MNSHLPPNQRCTALYQSIVCGIKKNPNSGTYQVAKTALNHPEKNHKHKISRRGRTRDIIIKIPTMVEFYISIFHSSTTNPIPFSCLSDPAPLTSGSHQRPLLSPYRALLPFVRVLSAYGNTSLCVARTCLSFTNALIMAIFTLMALSLFRTEDNIATPCSVNTWGIYFECFPFSKIPNWNLRV